MLDKIGINPTSLVAQIINFGVLFFLLSKLLYKPVLRLLEERAEKISQGLKAAEESLREKEKLETQKKEEMKKTQREMARILSQTKDEAKSMSESIILKAREEAKKEAVKEYEQLEQRLREEEKLLKDRVSKMVVELTKKTLADTLNQDQATQKKIFSAQLKKLKKIPVN